jgi:hypothetical protein
VDCGRPARAADCASGGPLFGCRQSVKAIPDELEFRGQRDHEYRSGRFRVAHGFDETPVILGYGDPAVSGFDDKVETVASFELPGSARELIHGPEVP